MVKANTRLLLLIYVTLVCLKDQFQFVHDVVKTYIMQNETYMYSNFLREWYTQPAFQPVSRITDGRHEHTHQYLTHTILLYNNLICFYSKIGICHSLYFNVESCFVPVWAIVTTLRNHFPITLQTMHYNSNNMKT